MVFVDVYPLFKISRYATAGPACGMRIYVRTDQRCVIITVFGVAKDKSLDFLATSTGVRVGFFKFLLKQVTT